MSTSVPLLRVGAWNRDNGHITQLHKANSRAVLSHITKLQQNRICAVTETIMEWNCSENKEGRCPFCLLRRVGIGEVRKDWEVGDI